MATQQFELEIITPEYTKKYSIEWVQIESPTGSFFVGPDHSPLVSIIKMQSTVSYKPVDASECFLPVTQGIFKVDNQKALILLDQ